ncbi:hypothetical protein WME75_33235 [Sorangium sp. So ce1014]
MFELLDEQGQSPDATPPAALPKVTGEVRFEHVTFRYKPDEPLIEDLDLTIMPGQTVAIVGPTGAAGPRSSSGDGGAPDGSGGSASTVAGGGSGPAQSPSERTVPL